jgi:hypothetical protein
MLTMTHSLGDLPLDAIAFCDLVARILYRCLKDQETRMLLIPMVSEHPSTTSSQGDDAGMQEVIYA